MMPRVPKHTIAIAFALSMALVVIFSLSATSSQSGIASPLVRRAGVRSNIRPRDMRANADVRSFADVDYRKFGSAYDGYRSILKAAKGLYGSDLKDFINDGYTVIDVRPQYEVERIRPSTDKCEHIPLIEEIKDGGLGSFARKWSNTVYAGHSRDLTRNTNFVKDVQDKYPADSKLIIACGEGLRSLVALKELKDAGYTNVIWLASGFSGVPKEDLPSEGTDADKVGYARAGLDGGQLASKVFDGITSIKWWEMGKK